MITRWFAVLLLSITMFPAGAQSWREAGSLEKIREMGAIYLGYREDALPLSYSVNGTAAGYSVDLCYRVVDAIKTRLGMPQLKTVEVPVPGNLRFNMLIDGIIDMECGVTTNTKLRQQRVAFAVSTFESEVKFLVRADSQLNRLADLNGKTVAVIAGTTASRVISNTAARHGLTLRTIVTKDRAQAFVRLKSGAADAFIGDDALLLGILLPSPDRERFRLMDEPLSAEPYGIVLRREDPEFKQLVDATLIGLMQSGEAERIYNKWFVAPIPPSGLGMNLPMSPRLRELFAKPSDSGL